MKDFYCKKKCDGAFTTLLVQILGYLSNVIIVKI